MADKPYDTHIVTQVEVAKAMSVEQAAIVAGSSPPM